MSQLGKAKEQALFEAIGRLIAEAKNPDFPDLLREFLSRDIVFVNFLILAFSKDRVPVDLYHWIPEAAPGVYQNIYFTTAYKLDPYYHAALKGDGPGVYALKEVAPDRFFQSEYYRSYYHRARMIDELGILSPAGDGYTLHLSLGRKRGDGPFRRAEIRALRILEPTVSALLQVYAADRLKAVTRQPAGDAPSSVISDLRALTDLGDRSCALTEREADVTSFILRGHSSNSIGLNLGISVETVKVHRKHIYAKLNVSSQAELFMKLLPMLSV